MSDRSCELHFAGLTNTQLVEVRFKSHLSEDHLVTIRGKTCGAYRNVGTFQWTSAVRALCILMVKAKLVDLSGGERDLATIRGDKGSFAASLDYAISKQPMWLIEMFGCDRLGISLMRRVILRSNPERKRPGPVCLSLNEKVFPPARIKAIWDGELLETASQLNRLLNKLGQRSAVSAIDQMSQVLREKIAA